MYPSPMMRKRVRRSLAFIFSGLSIAACAKNGGTQGPGDTSSSGGPGGSGSGATDGSWATDGSLPGSGDGASTLIVGDGNVTGDACQHFDVQFVPKIPLVSVLADRSGSMFQPISSV